MPLTVATYTGLPTAGSSDSGNGTDKSQEVHRRTLQGWRNGKGCDPRGSLTNSIHAGASVISVDLKFEKQSGLFGDEVRSVLDRITITDNGEGFTKKISITSMRYVQVTRTTSVAKAWAASLF